MGAAGSSCTGDPKSCDLESRAAHHKIQANKTQTTNEKAATETTPTNQKIDQQSSTTEGNVPENNKASVGEDIAARIVAKENAEKEESFAKNAEKIRGQLQDNNMDPSDEFKPGHASQVDNKRIKAGHTNTSSDSMIKYETMSAQEVEQTVKECWDKIEATCENSAADQSRNVVSCSSAGWRVVRLFVSSTFTDYHAEREVLVKKVFPELHEWCEGHRIQLIECDLRWGVPKYSTTETTIKTCLGEIDKCKEETDGVPFFLNMLGERYGWMPSPADVAHEIQTEYNWVFPVSITHMEILYAAFRNQNPNAAFLIRNPAFLDDLPPGMQGAFIDNAALSKAQLKKLKEKLRERFPGQVFDYSCQYDGIGDSTGKSKVCLKGLEEFGRTVLDFFKSAIERTFPITQEELTPQQIELAAHDNFIRSRGAVLVGRSSEVAGIMKYIDTGSLPGYVEEDKGAGVTPILLIQGVPGTGKSALMAYCTLQAKKLGCALFYHFVGCGPGSASSLQMANRLFSWLRDLTNYTVCNIEDGDGSADNEDIPLENMAEQMENVLAEAGKLDKNIVIILDAVNQLSDAEEGSGHLAWLPTGFPHNVHVIVSAVIASRSADLLLSEARPPRPVELLVGELDQAARKEIVQHILGIYNKKLDAGQMELLVGIEGASNPLWLSLACEELRVFGVFERVTEHIRSLPEHLKGLLDFILQRFIAEDEYKNVAKMLCVLECMRGGLNESELRWILGDTEPSSEPMPIMPEQSQPAPIMPEQPSEPMPMMKWAVLRRTLKPFLRSSSEQNQEERLNFFHASISEVVKDSMLTDNRQKKHWHLRIADYFQTKCKEEWRAIEIIPEQLKHSGDKKRLLDFLKNDRRAQRRSPVWKKQYYKVLVCGEIIPPLKGFSAEVAICQMCSTRFRGLGQLAGLNRDSCVVCGSHVHWKQDKYIALLCQRHKPFVGPGQKKCFICEQLAFHNTQKGYTCMICTPIIKKCIKCVV